MNGYILSLMPCCENCPEFEIEDNFSVVKVDNTDPIGFFDPPYTDIITHRISCKHDTRCRNMLKYLKKNDIY